jgi:DNA polymerase-3 subunit gamma/tau
MSYIVFARKWRPRNFDEVVGQEHITSTLKNAIRQGRVAHAFLFAGPRGIGKTSCARILAKSLNCQKGPTITPCEKCTSCIEINEARNFDVIEIDGASNRGIDEIRSLRENVKFAPTFGKYKIYIIDEVHMLTIEAFNALLKTLEEPPEHVKFIFATTQPNKVIPTILSRCHRFDFRKISITKIIEKLNKISREEKLNVDKEALFAIARAASGSMRDAESILDQLSAFSKAKIMFSDVANVLGIVEEDYLFEIVDKISQRDTVGAIKLIDRVINEGKDTSQFIVELIEHFRNLMIARVGGKGLEALLDLPPETKERVLKQSQHFSIQEIINSIEILIATQEISRKIDSLYIPLEIAITKLTSFGLSLETHRRDKRNYNPVKKQNNDGPQGTNDALEQKSLSVAQKVLDTSFQEIKDIWSNLISNISKIKMSVATFLQEGNPLRIEGNILIIGFSKESNFHRELLEREDNRRLIESNLKQILDKDVKIKFETIETIQRHHDSHEPFIKSAIDTFRGRLIDKWYKKD